jgi:hypothetical protein
MATSPAASPRFQADGRSATERRPVRSTETKAAFKTTELAKSGSRDPYTEDRDRR